MKRVCVATLLLVAMATAALGQEPRIYTTPKPPSREVLDRLSLTQAWRVKIPTEGHRDGFLSIQVIPGKTPKARAQIIVQLLSGAVLLLDAETGDTLWRSPTGEPYWQGRAAAYNSNSVFVTRREYLFIMDRANGDHRLEIVDPRSKQRSHGLPLTGVPSAAPAADDETVVVPINKRIVAYELPDYSLGEPAPTEKLDKAGAPNGSQRP